LVKEKSAIFRENLDEVKIVFEFYKEIEESKKNFSLTHDSLNPFILNNTSAKELIIANLQKLKKGQGKLLKFIKPVKEIETPLMVFEEPNKN
jgi:hypothetical protein